MFKLTPEILSENKKRNEALFSEYDPIRGIGSLVERVPVKLGRHGIYNLPKEMLEIGVVNGAFKEGDLRTHLKKTGYLKKIDNIIDDIMRIRIEYDFEYWAANCIEIFSKPSETNPDSVPIDFILNLPQRILLYELEKMRLAGVPIRFILLKARQWGGSTLTQMYMMWIQQIHKKNWNAAVVAQDDGAAMNIREMYNHAAAMYPKTIGNITLKPYAKSTKNLRCVETGGLLSVGSVQNPDQFRSYKYEMVHMSEVGMWGETAFKSSKGLAQSIMGSIPRVPYSMIGLESTAKGVGTFFHNKWTDAKDGKSDYVPVFIAWWLIEMYWKPIDDYEQFINNLNNGFKKKDQAQGVIKYAEFLWTIGASLESINWYFDYKQRENASDQFMFEEFPSTADEAFVSSGRRAFDIDYVNNARKHCAEPAFIGDIEGNKSKGADALVNIRIKEVVNGLMKIWQLPDNDINISHRYLIVVDIGGKWKGADWSVITVFDRYWMAYGGGEVVVAEWVGHLDQDLVAWKAAQVAAIYRNGLLVVERNSLKKKNEEASEGDHSMTILDEIAIHYNNLYARDNPDEIKEGLPPKYGFFTSTSTKPMVVDALNAALRDDDYEESNIEACNEMDVFEIKPDGTYGARKGSHDDMVMTRCIGIHISRSFMPIPKEIAPPKTGRKIISEATM